MLASVTHIRMGGAQRNPSSLFGTVIHVALKLFRVFATSREKLSLMNRADLTLQYNPYRGRLWLLIWPSGVGYPEIRSMWQAFLRTAFGVRLAFLTRGVGGGTRNPGDLEPAALFIIAAAAVPPFGLPALFRSVFEPVVWLICGGSR